MNKNIKLYEVILNDEDDGVSVMSLVETPANKSAFIKLADDKPIPKITLSGDDKMEVWGIVLKPNQKIYRNSDFEGGECEIFFSADTIKALEYKFSNDKDSQGVSTHHTFPTDEAYLLDSWICTDSDAKLLELGLEAPLGSWIAGYKITSDKLWDSIKAGNMNGFSIECDAGLKQIQMSADIEDTQEKEINELAEYIIGLL